MVRSVGGSSLNTLTRLAALAGLLAISGCQSLAEPNYNGGSVGELETAPTRTTVITAVQGVLSGTRENGWRVKFAGQIGREGWGLDPTNQESVQGPMVRLEPSRYYVTFLYTAYANIRLANVTLHALDVLTGFTNAEKEATRGFLKSIQAWDLLQLAEVFDASGLPIDVDHAPGTELAPIASKAEVYARINQLLDEAKTHLQNGGAAFPFSLTPGFASFNTPLTFLRFNRAAKARANAYIDNWNAVLTALGESFLNTSAPMSMGVYDNYSPNSGDISTPAQLYDPTHREVAAHASLKTDAQLRVSGTRDLRYETKVVDVPSRTTHGITVNLGFRIYTSTAASIPKIKNEELILLRAEANLGLGNRSAAIQDINIVRANSGGLPPISDPYVADVALKQPPTLLDVLLYEKRYSLMWEGAHRWANWRHYGKLAELPKYAPNHVVYPYYPLPEAECVPRNPKPPGCSVPAGL